MEHLFNLEIAGVHFSVRSSYPLSADRLAGTYNQFMGAACNPEADINIIVRIATGAVPDTCHMTKVFDSEQSWSVFRNQDDYFLSLNVPSATGRLLWLAAFKSYCNDISVYSSDLLMQNKDGQTIFFVPLTYPLDQLLLMMILSTRNGAIIHAAGMQAGGKGYIFPGRSGAGKSTISRLLSESDAMEMLSDDRMVIRKMDGKFRAFGTPWAGDAGIAENRSVPLCGLFFIHHADENRIKELKPIDAVKRLMAVTSIPWFDEKAIQCMLASCEDLVLHVPAYDLYFRPDSEAVSCLEAFISSNNL